MVQDQLVKLMSPTKRRAGRLRTGGRAIILTVENRGLSVLQLNVEGLTTAKLEVLRHLADSNGAAVLLLQETHLHTRQHPQDPWVPSRWVHLQQATRCSNNVRPD
ncbi:hypothetical protein KUCAC02_017200 [Chaenocephalus aceratus]|uniref:Uncharacterized protein n=1 Tax=Chaenocephalus aceratus TaxID=36190 RepID=A0ACB9W276_CHAAC|nr:hypothetical protein KUCAC02_017200 [Chaenocephalus aceratus]